MKLLKPQDLVEQETTAAKSFAQLLHMLFKMQFIGTSQMTAKHIARYQKRYLKSEIKDKFLEANFGIKREK